MVALLTILVIIIFFVLVIGLMIFIPKRNRPLTKDEIEEFKEYIHKNEGNSTRRR